MALPLTVSHADNEILYLKTKASSSGGPINVLGLPSSAVLRDVTAPPPRSVEFATRVNWTWFCQIFIRHCPLERVVNKVQMKPMKANSTYHFGIRVMMYR